MRPFTNLAYDSLQSSGSVTWQAPSNIALVKYWGKHSRQLAINPSVSFTLSNARTTTTLEWYKKDGSNDIQFLFEGNEKPDFAKRIQIYIDSIADITGLADGFKFVINSKNSFPHSAGIASSASAMAALSLCLRSMAESDENFQSEASILARLASGSACRSLFGGVVCWGESNLVADSSGHQGAPVRDIHPIFSTYQDSILIVDAGEKSVSSSAGHSLMTNHPFKEARIDQATKNFEDSIQCLRTGDVEKFITIVEEEALTLHGLMMNSRPSYTLMKPNTLKMIELIRNYRKDSGVPVCFTLDAGPNIHLLYPLEYLDQVQMLIETELTSLCEMVLHDEVGNGPLQMAEQK